MEYKQIQHRTAKKLYNEGKTLFLLPCKVSFQNIWIQPFELSNNNNNSWKNVINLYEYYNCNNELGKYTHFYVQLD